MSKVIRLIIVFLLTSMASLQVFAGCEYSSGYTLQSSSVNFGDIIAQRDAPIGTVLKKVVFTDLANVPENMIHCDDAPRNMKYGDSSVETIISDGVTYFNSGVEGIGIKVTSNSGWWQGVWNNGALPILLQGGMCNSGTGWIDYCGGSWGTGGLNFELVKIAEHTGTGNVISSSTILKASVENEIDAYNIGVVSSKITTLKCEITTLGLVFSIGDISAVQFGESPGVVPQQAQDTQNLGLNCDPDANINVSLAGAQNPDIDTASVLALTGQGSEGTAKGVGVQLLYNDVPLELNKNIVLKKSTGGQETFPIVARYYQTQTTVMPGKANASATLNITYQ